MIQPALFPRKTGQRSPESSTARIWLFKYRRDNTGIPRCSSPSCQRTSCDPSANQGIHWDSKGKTVAIVVTWNSRKTTSRVIHSTCIAIVPGKFDGRSETTSQTPVSIPPETPLQSKELGAVGRQPRSPVDGSGTRRPLRIRSGGMLWSRNDRPRDH